MNIHNQSSLSFEMESQTIYCIYCKGAVNPSTSETTQYHEFCHSEISEFASHQEEVEKRNHFMDWLRSILGNDRADLTADDLPLLKDLSLIGTNIDKIPSSISCLKQLKELRLNHNELRTLPMEIGELQNLERLFITHNQLESLPKSMGNLKKLRQLILHNNQLSDLPKSFEHLPNLGYIDLDVNNFMSLPPLNADVVQTIKLSKNQLSKFPKAILYFKNLVYLSLYNNTILAIPNLSGRRSFLKLHTFYINGNRLSSIPNSISELKSLKELSISSNKLSSLPKSLSQLNLKELYMENNNLSTIDKNLLRYNKVYLTNNPLSLETKFDIIENLYQRILAFEKEKSTDPLKESGPFNSNLDMISIIFEDHYICKKCGGIVKRIGRGKGNFSTTFPELEKFENRWRYWLFKCDNEHVEMVKLQEMCVKVLKNKEKYLKQADIEHNVP